MLKRSGYECRWGLNNLHLVRLSSFTNHPGGGNARRPLDQYFWKDSIWHGTVWILWVERYRRICLPLKVWEAPYLHILATTPRAVLEASLIV